jgi:hypothetical protein
LEPVEPIGAPHDEVLVPVALPVVAAPAHAPGDVGPAGGDRPAVAEGAQVLRGVEAERGGIAERTDRPVAPCRAERLGRVLQVEQPVPIGDGGEPVGVVVRRARPERCDFVDTGDG